MVPFFDYSHSCVPLQFDVLSFVFFFPSLQLCFKRPLSSFFSPSITNHWDFFSTRQTVERHVNVQKSSFTFFIYLQTLLTISAPTTAGMSTVFSCGRRFFERS